MLHDVPAPVTGSVWMLSAGVGQTVFEGNDLLILESMKMEVPVQAPVAGTVSWLAASGTTVNEGDTVATIEAS